MGKDGDGKMSELMKANDYRSGLKPIWCPGCGDFGFLNALTKTFEELQLKTEDPMQLSLLLAVMVMASQSVPVILGMLPERTLILLILFWTTVFTV
jgi:pyruvate/2-oxoacid:ferredoxin oxidoreductase beta subunit